MDPKDIHQKEFKRSMRGYNEEEVDVFLDEVALAIERMIEERDELKTRLIELQDKIKSYERMENTIQETLLNAQKTAEDVQIKVKREAELMAKDTEMRAKIVISRAEEERNKIAKSMADMLEIKNDFKTKFQSFIDGFLIKLDEAVRVEESKMEALNIISPSNASPTHEEDEGAGSNATDKNATPPPSQNGEILPNFLADGPRIDFLKDS
ncbi:MAG: DivIVA domain-containing protein [Actinomycetota bacterium]|nr:DivIVA domain-containing protein [Actinomycetota bacterium]